MRSSLGSNIKRAVLKNTLRSTAELVLQETKLEVVDDCMIFSTKLNMRSSVRRELPEVFKWQLFILEAYLLMCLSKILSDGVIF